MLWLGVVGALVSLPRGAESQKPETQNEAQREASPVSSVLADLPSAVREALEKRKDALEPAADSRAVLQAVMEASTPYDFDAGALFVRTDPRWFATVPPEGLGAPLLVLRRWPGDSVMAFYAVEPSAARPGDHGPPIGDARFEALHGAGPTKAAWEGVVNGPGGARPALWVEEAVAESETWLGTLMLPGDAGLGEAGIKGVTEEMLAVRDRVGILGAAWRALSPVPASATVLVPLTAETPGTGNEKDAPWQVARARGFTIGLPPGFRAQRMDGNIPPPQSLEGALLWMRGRFVDMDGNRVGVGDERRFGYVAAIAQPDKAWRSGERPPRGAPDARRIAGEGFALLAERTEAEKATAERWQEPGFAGEWLVFRLDFSDHAFEIGLPVVEGRRSVSLYWIPVTWRDERRPPAPPPVDPAERFGIKFERLSPVARTEQPWYGGYLTVPGMRVDVSSGWIPAASLRSADGFPVRFVDEQGREVARLLYLSSDEVSARESSLQQLVEVEGPKRHRAARAFRDAAGDYLFIAPEGYGFLFEFTASSAELADASLEDERKQWTMMMRSVKLQPR